MNRYTHALPDYHHFLILPAVALSAAVIYQVSMRAVSLVSLGIWLGSIMMMWLALSKETHGRPMDRFIDRKDIYIMGLLSVVGLVILRYFGGIPSHYHQDEFITAYTSWTLPEVATMDWFAGYPEVWVSRFPVLFHLLQKPFLVLLGPSVESIRISVWPYYAGIIVYLYVLAKMVGSRRLGFTAVAVFIVLAPNVYLSSMGLHFISSTFFYIATMFHFLAFLKSKNIVQALWTGMFCALSYLTYTSSYIAYPVIVTIGLLAYFRTRSSDVAIALGKLSILVLFILAPFLAHASFVNNYFLQRISQVNVFWGSWSDMARTDASPVSIVVTQTTNALRSLVIPGVGGLGGYNFGKLSLLDPLTGVLFILGLGILVSHAIGKKREDALSLLIVFMVPFISGFILTTHPPPFHRISLLYPFFALIIAWSISSLTKQKKPVGLLLMALVLALIATMNVRHARAMIRADADLYPQNSRVIGDFINRTVPKGETILIASYPSFYLGQELLFRTNNHYVLITGEEEAILKEYHGEFLIVFQPSKIIISTLAALYPTHRWVRSLEGVPLGDVALFVPEQ